MGGWGKSAAKWPVHVSCSEKKSKRHPDWKVCIRAGSVAVVPCVSCSDRDNVLLSPGHSLLRVILTQPDLFRHCQVRKVILIVNVVMFIIEIIIINNNSSSRIGRNKKVIFDRRDQLFGLHQHQQHHQRIFGDSMIIYT